MLNDWKLDINHLVRAFMAQRRLIIAGTALATILGVVLLSMQDDVYTADAMIRVQETSLNVPEAEAIIEQTVADTETVLGHVELMKGPDVLRRALGDLANEGIVMYDADEGSGPGLLASVKAAIPLWDANATPGEETIDDAGNRLTPEQAAYSQDLGVEVLGRTRLIKVSFEHSDPRLAAAGANALADAYVALRREEQLSVGNDAVQWMMEQAAELRRKSTEADKAVEQFRRDSGLLQSDGSRLIEQKITEINNQLTEAELESVSLSTKVNAIEQALRNNNPFAVSEIANAPSIVELRTQITAFNSEIADLRADFGPNHPLLLAKQEQITLAQRSINEEINNIVVGFRNEARAAEQRVGNLRTLLGEQQQVLADANLRGVELSDLEKEAQIGNEALEGFLGRLQEVSAREDLRVQPNDLQVVNRAQVPRNPSGPPRAVLSLVFLIGGFLISGTVAMFREASRRVVRDPDDLKAITNCNVWVIPRRTDHHRNRDEVSTLHHLISTSPYAHFSASVRNAYRQTIATLPENEQVIMLTSAQPGDGKTTMSLCFSEVVANTGKSVVLVDTDFRRAKIHLHTGLGRIAGLSDWLEGTEPLRCRRPDRSEFYTITAGSTELARPDRWNTQSIKELIATLRERFDCVILDTPPVAALADPFLVAAESSMVLFVTRWQHTKLNYVRDFVGPLKERTPRVEVILTDVDIKNAASQGYTTPMEYYKDTAQYYTE